MYTRQKSLHRRIFVWTFMQRYAPRQDYTNKSNMKSMNKALMEAYFHKWHYGMDE